MAKQDSTPGKLLKKFRGKFAVLGTFFYAIKLGINETIHVLRKKGHIIFLTDDEGNEKGFEFLSMAKVDENDYAVLIPLEEKEEKILVLKAEDDEDGKNITLSGVDETESERVINTLTHEFSGEV